MNKEKILASYRHEKDERLLQLHGKAFMIGLISIIILSIFFMLLSFQFQDIPTVYYTIYILIIPAIIIVYGVKGYIEKSKTYLIISFIWLIIGIPLFSTSYYSSLIYNQYERQVKFIRGC